MSDDREPDLRGAIRNLKSVAKILDATKFNFEMNALASFVEGIKVDKPAKPSEDILKPLLEKFLRGERNFSAREVRALPFIIYEPKISSHDTAWILRELDFSKTNHLRRVISIYLLNYDDSNKTEQLRQALDSVRNVESSSLQKIFAARDKLFGKECFTNMAKFFAQKRSVTDSLETIGLSDFYKASNFIGAALKNFFRQNAASLSVQMKLLAELDAEYETYRNIFPAVADSLIQTVYRAGNFKAQCVEIFYGRLGDPRFGDTRFNWKNVSQMSRDIFCQWLSKEDLETFFKIVAETSNDAQWSYRESFWSRYLPRITNTWIFLTGNAKHFAAQSKLNHGNLKNGNGNQAVFVFQVGKYIFSEWSNVGKVRAHDSGWKDFLFGRHEINGEFIRKNFKAEWVHSSPQTGFWQREVDAWIRDNC